MRRVWRIRLIVMRVVVWLVAWRVVLGRHRPPGRIMMRVVRRRLQRQRVVHLLVLLLLILLVLLR